VQVHLLRSHDATGRNFFAALSQQTSLRQSLDLRSTKNLNHKYVVSRKKITDLYALRDKIGNFQTSPLEYSYAK